MHQEESPEVFLNLFYFSFHLKALLCWLLIKHNLVFLSSSSRKHKGQSVVCDESVYTENSGQFTSIYLKTQIHFSCLAGIDCGNSEKFNSFLYWF